MADQAGGSGGAEAQQVELPVPESHDDILRIFNAMRDQVRAIGDGRAAQRRALRRSGGRAEAGAGWDLAGWE